MNQRLNQYEVSMNTFWHFGRATTRLHPARHSPFAWQPIRGKQKWLNLTGGRVKMCQGMPSLHILLLTLSPWAWHILAYLGTSQVQQLNQDSENCSWEVHLMKNTDARKIEKHFFRMYKLNFFRRKSKTQSKHTVNLTFWHTQVDFESIIPWLSTADRETS